MTKTERQVIIDAIHALAIKLEGASDRAEQLAREAYPNDRSAHMPFALGVMESIAASAARDLKAHVERLTPKRKQSAA